VNVTAKRWQLPARTLTGAGFFLCIFRKMESLIAEISIGRRRVSKHDLVFFVQSGGGFGLNQKKISPKTAQRCVMRR
jgi:hypothetical protein